jgi:hypothetical protein
MAGTVTQPAAGRYCRRKKRTYQVPVLKQFLLQNRFFSNRFPRSAQILLGINRALTSDQA